MHHQTRSFGFKTLALVALLLFAGTASVQAQTSKEAFLAAFKAAVKSSDFTAQRSLVSNNRKHAFDSFFDVEIEVLQARQADNVEAGNAALSVLEGLSSNYRLEFSEKFLNDRLRWVNSIQGDDIQKRIDAYYAEINGLQGYRAGENGDEAAYRSALQSYSDALQLSYAIKDYFKGGQAAQSMSFIHSNLNEYFESAYYALWCQRIGVEGGLSDREEFMWVAGYLSELNEKRRVTNPELIDITIQDLDEAKKAHAKAVKGAQDIPSTPGEANGSGEGGKIKAPVSEDAFEWATDEKYKLKVEKKVWTKMPLPWYRDHNIGEGVLAKNPFVQWDRFEKDADPRDWVAFPGVKGAYDGKLNLQSKAMKRAKPYKIGNKFGKVKVPVKYEDGTVREITHQMMDYRAEGLELFGTKFSSPEGAAKLFEIAWYGQSAITGKVRGHDVTIIDTNGNGSFRDTGADTIIVGKGRNARIEPLGTYVFLPAKNGWYPYNMVVVDAAGTKIRTRPYRGQLAAIHVEYKTGSGDMPTYLIARGTGADTEAYFDLMKGLDPEKPLFVPAGGYEFFKGYFLFGKGKKQSFLIMDKGRSGIFKAEAGRLNTWALGGAGEKGFWMLGKATRPEKDEVLVKGLDIQVFGNFGERYRLFAVERLEPKILIAKDKEGDKIVAKEEMRPPGGSGINAQQLWFPADTTVKKVPRSGDLYFKLEAKHGKLGEMESSWDRVN